MVCRSWSHTRFACRLFGCQLIRQLYLSFPWRHYRTKPNIWTLLIMSKGLSPWLGGEKARGTIKFDFCKSLQCLRLFFLPFLKHSAAQSTVSCRNPFLSQIMVNLNRNRTEVLIWNCKALASSYHHEYLFTFLKKQKAFNSFRWWTHETFIRIARCTLCSL